MAIKTRFCQEKKDSYFWFCLKTTWTLFKQMVIPNKVILSGKMCFIVQWGWRWRRTRGGRRIRGKSARRGERIRVFVYFALGKNLRAFWKGLAMSSLSFPLFWVCHSCMISLHHLHASLAVGEKPFKQILPFSLILRFILCFLDSLFLILVFLSLPLPPLSLPLSLSIRLLSQIKRNKICKKKM